jgi:hypothetical protein
MAWRKAAAGPAAGAAAVLDSFAAELEDAAAGGDTWAARRLPSVLSWIAMLAHSGGDADVGGLFLEFARGDQETWLRRHDGLA